MKLTREEAREMDYKAQKVQYKRMLRTKGENVVYHSLRNHNTSGKIYGIKISDFVEMLKAEIKQEDKIK